MCIFRKLELEARLRLKPGTLARDMSVPNGFLTIAPNAKPSFLQPEKGSLQEENTLKIKVIVSTKWTLLFTHEYMAFQKVNLWADAVDNKSLFGIPICTPVRILVSLLLIQIIANAPKRLQMMAQVPGPLPPIWETQMMGVLGSWFQPGANMAVVGLWRNE